MRGLIEDRKGAIVIAAVVLMLSLAVLAASLYGSGRAPAQAHDDGTLHIHPTLTPTPTPTPTPLPALGLNGPLSLETHIIYEQSQHRLIVTAAVKNPPPEGWQQRGLSVSVNGKSKGWTFENHLGNSDHDYQSMTFQDDVLTASLPLPEYIDFNQLTEPAIFEVRAMVTYSGIGEGSLRPSESIHVDLNDRANWRE